MKRTLVKVRKAERKAKRIIHKKRSSFVEYFMKRMDREIKPLIVLN